VVMYAVHPPQLTCITFRFVVNICITCTVCDRVMTTAVKDGIGVFFQYKIKKRLFSKNPNTVKDAIFEFNYRR